MTDNFKSPNIKKEIKIVVDEDHGIKEFGSDTFENLITHFVESDYEDKKKDLEDSIRDKDIIKLKNVLHKIKTLTMYMNCVDLAQLCKDIEFFTHKGHENHETAFSMVPEFLTYFSKLYEEAYKLYRVKYLQITEEVSAYKDKSNSNENNSEDKQIPPTLIQEDKVKQADINGLDASISSDKLKSFSDINPVNITAKVSNSSKNNLQDINKVGGQPVRNLNFINIESGSFTNTQFTFGNEQIKNEKYENDIFSIDTSPVIEKKDIDEDFKEKLKIFIEIEAPKLSLTITDAIESDKKEELTDAIKKLKSAAAICFFNQLVSKIEDWCKFINQSSSVKELTKHLEKIQLVINKMIDEASSVLHGKSSSNTKNYVFSISHPKINATNIKDYMTSPGHKKVIDNKNLNLNNQPTSLNNYLISRGNEEDNILFDLKPLKFDGLFKKDLTEEEIAEEIKRLSESTIKEQSSTQNKSRITKQIIKPITNSSYPFKQETFAINCLII